MLWWVVNGFDDFGLRLCCRKLVNCILLLLFVLMSLIQPGISPETRKSLGEAAVRAAQAVSYVGAGMCYVVFERVLFA